MSGQVIGISLLPCATTKDCIFYPHRKKTSANNRLLGILRGFCIRAVADTETRLATARGTVSGDPARYRLEP